MALAPSTRYQLSIAVILGVIALLQWLLLGPLAMQRGVISSLDEVPDAGVREAAEKRPLRRDLWFVLWNIFPFAMLGLILFIDHFWTAWIAALSLVYPALPATVVEVEQFWDAAWITGIFLVVGVWGAVAQIPKQRGFIENKDHAYWWDWRISRRIFIVRAVVLVTNMVLLLVGLASVARGYHLAFSIADMAPQPVFLHPDGSAGIAPLGELALAGSLVLIFLSGCGVVAMLDHRSQGRLHLTGDLFLVSLAFVALLLFAMPLEAAHRNVLFAYEQAIAQVGPGVIEEFALFARTGSAAAAENVGLMAQALARPKYPANIETLLQMLTSFLLPVLVYALRAFRKQVKGVILDASED